MGSSERHSGLDMDKGGARLHIEGNEMQEWMRTEEGCLVEEAEGRMFSSLGEKHIGDVAGFLSSFF